MSGNAGALSDSLCKAAGGGKRAAFLVLNVGEPPKNREPKP